MPEWIGVQTLKPTRYPQAFERRTYRGAGRPRQGFCPGNASVPNPKFASFSAGAFANFGFERTLETYDSSVVLVRKFSWRTRGGNEENFRTTTLVEAAFRQAFPSLKIVGGLQASSHKRRIRSRRKSPSRPCGQTGLGRGAFSQGICVV